MDLAEQRSRFDKQGFSLLLGIEFDHAEEGFARLRMLVTEHHLQSAQTVHGGILATIADAAGAQALHTVLKDGESFSTIELKLNYLRPAQAGDTLIAEGRIIQKGGRIALGDMEIKNASSGRLVVKGLCTSIIIRDSPQ